MVKYLAKGNGQVTRQGFLSPRCKQKKGILTGHSRQIFKGEKKYLQTNDKKNKRG